MLSKLIKRLESFVFGVCVNQEVDEIEITFKGEGDALEDLVSTMNKFHENHNKTKIIRVVFFPLGAICGIKS